MSDTDIWTNKIESLEREIEHLRSGRAAVWAECRKAVDDLARPIETDQFDAGWNGCLFRVEEALRALEDKP